MSTIEIEGRSFERVNDWTVEQDWWLMQRIVAAGLSEIQVPPGATDDMAQILAEKMTARLAESGAFLEILGGLLVPEGSSVDDWTPAMAAETTEFLKKQRGVETRQTVRGLASWAVVLFFGNGLVSFRISPTSSTGEPDVKAEEALSPSGEEAQA